MSTNSVRDLRLDLARRWVNDNAATVATGCVAVLAVSLHVLSWHATSRQAPVRPTHAWYYDSTTKQIVTRPLGMPPTLVEEGRELWRLHVFACADCSDAPLEYYERCAPERRDRFQELYRISRDDVLSAEEENEYYDLCMMGREYSRDGVTWRPLTPETEHEQMLEFEQICARGTLRMCHPEVPVR